MGHFNCPVTSVPKISPLSPSITILSTREDQYPFTNFRWNYLYIRRVTTNKQRTFRVGYKNLRYLKWYSPGLAEIDSWPDKILLLELKKKLKRFAQWYLNGSLRVKTDGRTYFIRLVDRFTSETSKINSRAIWPLSTTNRGLKFSLHSAQ